MKTPTGVPGAVQRGTLHRRTGTVSTAAPATVPDQRSGTALALAPRRIRNTMAADRAPHGRRRDGDFSFSRRSPLYVGLPHFRGGRKRPMTFFAVPAASSIPGSRLRRAGVPAPDDRGVRRRPPAPGAASASGSRGARTFTAPAATPTAPKAAQPFEPHHQPSPAHRAARRGGGRQCGPPAWA